MTRNELDSLGRELTALVKQQGFFPYKSGHLRDHATFGYMENSSTFCLHFSGVVAPYVEYLEEGTQPHDIPNAFGFGMEFGIGGRFDGKFHPGSTKHKGFISNKTLKFMVDYIANKYNGEVVIQ